MLDEPGLAHAKEHGYWDTYVSNRESTCCSAAHSMLSYLEDPYYGGGGRAYEAMAGRMRSELEFGPPDEAHSCCDTVESVGYYVATPVLAAVGRVPGLAGADLGGTWWMKGYGPMPPPFKQGALWELANAQRLWEQCVRARGASRN